MIYKFVTKQALTMFALLLSVQNSTRMGHGNETETYLSVTKHPDVQYYQSVYGAFIVVILASSLLRGVFFIKVCIFPPVSECHSLA